MIVWVLIYWWFGFIAVACGLVMVWFIVLDGLLLCWVLECLLVDSCFVIWSGVGVRCWVC